MALSETLLEQSRRRECKAAAVIKVGLMQRWRRASEGGGVVGVGHSALGARQRRMGVKKSGKMERKWHPVKCGQRQILTPANSE